MRRRRGFTLIEMMIVILVIAILALIVGFAVRNAGHRAKQWRKGEDCRSIRGACIIYLNDTNQRAQTIDDLIAETGPDGYRGPYMSGRPKDPYSQGEYVIDDGELTGPGDVTDFQN
jgi:prepilin-type N-terminal cleavage/methylation domain-containing protein